MKRIIALLIILATLLTCSCNFLPGGGTETESVGAAHEQHVDVDDNGVCDTCYTPVIVTIDFYAINDLHGKFNNTALDEGVDEMTTFLKKTEDLDDYTVFLSSGDMWQGGSESNLTEGRIITDWMNAVGFTSMTLGNHEYDWGEEPIIENEKIAEFPFLAINIYDRDTNERVEYCSASVVVERGGLQIGIIGAMGDCYSSIAPEQTEGVYFITGSKLTELVKAESERLRAEGVDYIVYSLHDGYDRSKTGQGYITDAQLSAYYDVELSRGGYVDLVFEGHSHASYALEDSYGVYHLQDGGDNQGISHVEVNINKANFNTRVTEAEFLSAVRYVTMEPDPIVEQLLEKYKDEIAEAARVVGYNAYSKNGQFIRSMVADAYLNKGIELWGDEYDIVLGGGFVSVRSPGYLVQGEVTYGMLQMLLPFDNQLVLCSIKGSDLRRRFIESTNSNYCCSYDEGLPDAIQDDKTYYIVVDSFTSSYAPNRLTEVARLDEEIYARDLVADFIAGGGLE